MSKTIVGLHCDRFDGCSRDWNDTVASLPGAHILQTWEWGYLKHKYNWEPIRLIWRTPNDEIKAAAQILERTIRPGGIGPSLRIAYSPRGPLLDWNDGELRKTVLGDLEQFAKSERVIFLKMDPEILTTKGIPDEVEEIGNSTNELFRKMFEDRRWRFSSEQIQFRNTVWLDLEGTEEELLARMKQKTRYNIRLADKKGVCIRRGGMEDLSLLYHMYAETSIRDGFVIRSEEYYRQVWGDFHNSGMAEFLIAEVDQEPVAALILFIFASRAWYLYGMSRDAHREKMPNYLLQWEAIRHAKASGCKIYDLWGAPDEFTPEDSMWGVFRFKQGLGGQVIRTMGAWDFPAKRLLYPIYTVILPKILSIMRRHGIERTRREVTL